MRHWVNTIRGLAWYKIFAPLVFLLSTTAAVLFHSEGQQDANIFFIGFTILFLYCPVAALLTLGIKKPRIFGVVMTVLILCFFYYTEIYLRDELTFELPDNTGKVTFLRTITPLFIAQYDREYRFETPNGKVIQSEVGPNISGGRTHIDVYWKNGIVKLKDHDDTIWIDSRKACMSDNRTPTYITDSHITCDPHSRSKLREPNNWSYLGYIATHNGGLAFITQ